jgi:polyhydroxyalkanoate synthesis repressor PhaR
LELTAVTRTIKKYPNRRLYDTQQSRYITIDEIRQFVVNREPISVVDNRSHEILTRSILLQLVTELERSDSPMFSEQFLARLIRARGTHSAATIRECLERGLDELERAEAPAAATGRL